ncbi:hypothetical protein B0O99DRAFT_625998 [Bisporella sp. PMI_857]|nr:hypothetical protein B0O99DRAFT_625998 [Bisporella sp. PMI_857]
MYMCVCVCVWVGTCHGSLRGLRVSDDGAFTTDFGVESSTVSRVYQTTGSSNVVTLVYGWHHEDLVTRQSLAPGMEWHQLRDGTINALLLSGHLHVRYRNDYGKGNYYVM